MKCPQLTLHVRALAVRLPHSWILPSPIGSLCSLLPAPLPLLTAFCKVHNYIRKPSIINAFEGFSVSEKKCSPFFPPFGHSIDTIKPLPSHAGCCPGPGDRKGTRETGPLALVGLTFSKFSFSEGVTFSKRNTHLNDGNSFPRKQRQTISS